MSPRHPKMQYSCIDYLYTWNASDRVHRILTLGTPDGFEVSFALQDDDAGSLAVSLGEHPRGATVVVPKMN